MASFTRSKVPEVTLQIPTDWYRWAQALEDEAFSHNYWKFIDPDGPDEVMTRPTRPTRESTYAALVKKAIREKKKESPGEVITEDDVTVTRAETTAALETEVKIYLASLTEWKEHSKSISSRQLIIDAWVKASVESSLYHTAAYRAREQLEKRSASIALQRESSGSTTPSTTTLELGIADNQEIQDHDLVARLNLKTIVQQLREILSPNSNDREADVRESYVQSLKDARRGNQPFDVWFRNWNTSYRLAQEYDLPEIKGLRGVTDFLTAVKAKYHTSWADNQLQRISDLQSEDGAKKTLEELGLQSLKGYANRLQSNMNQKTRGDRISSINATVEGTAEHDCVCSRGKHPWPAERCGSVEAAYRGKAPMKPRGIKDAEATIIKNKVNKPEWKTLKETLRNKGWLANKGQPDGSNTSRPPGGFTGVLLDAADDLLCQQGEEQQPEEYQGIHAAASARLLSRLANSTIIDDGSAHHVVNSQDLLVPGSFVPHEVTILAGTSSFQASGTGKRIMRGVFKLKGKPEDLTLTDVLLIEGFHVNIVSASKLKKRGNIWKNGCDDTLRYGTTMQNSVNLMKLTLMHNLLFIEYKPLQSYPEVQDCVLHVAEAYQRNDSYITTRSTEAMLTEHTTFQAKLYEHTNYSPMLVGVSIATKHFRRWRPRVDPPRPRRDDIELWHVRTGHLSGRALLEIANYGRNAQFTSTVTRKGCECCAQTYTKQVISKHSSTNKAVRPFQRVSWDLQEYTSGSDSSKYLMTFKDEYSKWLLCFCLATKSETEVMDRIDDYYLLLRRQFSLRIACLRSDNETSVLPHHTEGRLKEWARERGILLELTPPYTHEPNGGIERANQEVTTKSITMLKGANLPSWGWTYSCPTAVKLLNMSPKQSHGWKSPNQVLYEWIQKEIPLSQRGSIDLRTDWSGIYAYGCRAYPLKKTREAGKDRKFFKTEYRGHIGYLIGYVASNIYQIWVPQLRKVITTRNVTFDETKFYEGSRKEAAEVDVREQEYLSVQLDEPDVDGNYAENLEALAMIAMREGTDASASGVDAGLRVQQNNTTPVEHSEEQAMLTEHTSPSTTLTEHTMPGMKLLKKSVIQGITHKSQPSEQGPQTVTPRETPEPSTGPGVGELSATSTQQSREMLGEHSARSQTTDLGASPNPLTQTVHASGPGEVSAAHGDTQGTATPDVTRDTPEVTTAVVREGVQSQGTTGTPEQEHTRRSGRSRKRPARFISFLAGNQEEPLIIEEQWEPIMETFMPDQQQRFTSDYPSIQTVFAMLAGALQADPSARPSKKPGKQIHRNELTNAPNTWKETRNHPMRDEFDAAMDEEINNLKAAGTWREIPRDEARTKPLPLKWVYTYKFNETGHLERCKARICVRGDLQHAATITSTYAATLTAKSFRLAIAMAAHFDLEMHQFDVKQAFLQAYRDSDEPVVCELPEGYKKRDTAVELIKALYGLRDSPLLWYKEFTKTLTRLGMTPSKEEPCLFKIEGTSVMLIFYVDDILFFYHKKDEVLANKVIKGLMDAYEMHHKKEATWFLGVQIIRDRQKREIYLSHAQYIEKMAAKYGVSDQGWTPKVPLAHLLEPYRGEATAPEIKGYQERVGSILYTAIVVRPDVAFAVSQLSKFLTNPGPEHHKAATQVIRYLYTMRHLSLTYGNQALRPQVLCSQSTPDGVRNLTKDLVITSDASFADDGETRRSSQGYLIMLFGGPITWKATRQNTVTTSTTEAELLALTETVKEAMATKRLFREIQLDPRTPWIVGCDNLQTITNVTKDDYRISTKLRHVDIHNLWIRQEYKKGSFDIYYLPTAYMPADGLTKALPGERFKDFREALNFTDTSKYVTA